MVGITRAGLIAEGFDPEAEQIAVTASFFGLDAAELTFEEAKELAVAGVITLDGNENGFVCATALSGRHSRRRLPRSSSERQTTRTGAAALLTSWHDNAGDSVFVHFVSLAAKFVTRG